MLGAKWISDRECAIVLVSKTRFGYGIKTLKNSNPAFEMFLAGSFRQLNLLLGSSLSLWLWWVWGVSKCGHLERSWKVWRQFAVSGMQLISPAVWGQDSVTHGWIIITWPSGGNFFRNGTNWNLNFTFTFGYSAWIWETGQMDGHVYCMQQSQWL